MGRDARSAPKPNSIQDTKHAAGKTPGSLKSAKKPAAPDGGGRQANVKQNTTNQGYKQDR